MSEDIVPVNVLKIISEKKWLEIFRGKINYTTYAESPMFVKIFSSILRYYNIPQYQTQDNLDIKQFITLYKSWHETSEEDNKILNPNAP